MATEPITDTPVHVMIAAGGTGGHLFPALALALELGRRHARVELMTDERGQRYGDMFQAAKVHQIPAATLQLKPSIKTVTGIARIVRGVYKAQRILHRARPGVLVAFGGYPTLPPLAAGLLQGITTCLHEQNAVMGRVNRLFAPFAAAVASSFPELKGAGARLKSKTRYTGNPIREQVLAQRKAKYHPPAPEGPFKLLVFGGSQGASVFAEIVPPAIADLPPGLRGTIKVTQQARVEDMERVRAAYEAAGVEAEIAPFFQRLAERMADAHLVIARAGATTVSELAIIGRPAILVPLPHSLDNDQLHNAHHFVYSGGGWLIEQSEFSLERVASMLVKLRYSPDELVAAAHAAAQLGKPDAVGKLADLVLELAARGKHDDAKSNGDEQDDAPRITTAQSARPGSRKPAGTTGRGR